LLIDPALAIPQYSSLYFLLLHCGNSNSLMYCLNHPGNELLAGLVFFFRRKNVC